MKNQAFVSVRYQRGVAAIEFALVSTVLFTLLFGIIEFGRLLFYWNTATEATRLGARVAVVCDQNAASIKAKMTALFPVIESGDIVINYLPGGCDAATCEQITVSISRTTPIQTFIPFVPLSLTLPSFSTTLPRESMKSSIDSVANPVCN